VDFIQLAQDIVHWWALLNSIEFSDSMKGWVFLDHMVDCQFLKEVSASWS